MTSDAERPSSRLPLIEPPTASAPHAIESQSTGPEIRIKVLLVSDLLMIREALRHLLEARCCIVVAEATQCQEALDLATAHPPDIFLVDLESRAETLECLDELMSAHPRKIIALSRRADVVDHARFVERGAAGVVLKNDPLPVLIKAISKVYAGEAWLDRANTAKVLARISRRRREEGIEAEKIAKLTARERQVIALVGEGLKNAAIAERLFISEATARNHLTSILDKLGLSDRFELAVYAFRQGLVQYRDLDSTQV